MRAAGQPVGFQQLVSRMPTSALNIRNVHLICSFFSNELPHEMMLHA